MSEVDVTESYVVGLVTDSSEVCFTLDARLTRDHPLFYWPHKDGEVGVWARLRWCLRGEVWWNDGPHLDRPATDATGELDWGNIGDMVA